MTNTIQTHSFSQSIISMVQRGEVEEAKQALDQFFDREQKKHNALLELINVYKIGKTIDWNNEKGIISGEDMEMIAESAIRAYKAWRAAFEVLGFEYPE